MKLNTYVLKVTLKENGKQDYIYVDAYSTQEAVDRARNLTTVRFVHGCYREMNNWR